MLLLVISSAAVERRRSGDREKDGERNCEGGAEIGGVGAIESGVCVTGVVLLSTASPISLLSIS